jgi:hypothetical protein
MGLTAAAQSGAATFSTWLNVAGQDGASPNYANHYALTQPSVIVAYLQRMFVPMGLNIDPEHLPVTSIWAWRFFAPVALLIGIFVGSFLWYRRRPTDPRRIVAFGFVLWFFLGFSIDSSIVPLPDLMSEHRSYLSTIGFFCAVACVADTWRTYLHPWPELRWIVPSLIGIWVIGLTAATVERHERWRSNIALWSDAAAKSPHKPRVWANLGTAYGNRGLNSRAAEAYGKAIALEPRNVQACFNLVKVEMRLGNYRGAIAIAESGLTVDPRGYALHQLIAESFIRLQEYRNAIDAVNRSLALRPGELWSHLAAAECHARLGQYAAAREHCAAARAIGLPAESQQNWLRNVEALIPPEAASP